MRLNDPSAEELDIAQVLLDVRPEADRLKALAAIFIGDERSVGLRDRTEEAGRGVADGVVLLGGNIEAEDVRSARIIGRPVQALAIGREGEALGNGRWQGEA